MSKETVIEVSNLQKVTKKKSRLQDVSFRVYRGECFALCGGNGAGKSTFLNILTGQLKPTSGEINVLGSQPSQRNVSYKRLFSYMPDHTLFPSTLTGYETLLYFAKLQGIALERVEELLDRVGLLEAANNKTQTYSKGMQQRLALAQALLPQAPLLILDEPTNGMDPYWVYRFKEMIQDEKKRGTTIIYTSHIMHDVEEVADRAAFLNEGQLLTIQTIDKFNEIGGLEKIFFQTIHHTQKSG
ncbi:ABC transporter ATP-binding protein [Bacillus tianshenii]|nr:ABC transporter ATP-binding protein [Bacillus tianshenii]